MGRLKEMRRIRKISQKEIGRRLGVSQSYYARKERGETKFYLDEAVSVSNMLGISIEEFCKCVLGKGTR